MPTAPFKRPASAAPRIFDAETATEPLALFAAWLRLAAATEPNDPEAAALATSTLDGTPSVRMVLVKRIDHDGFRFFTNAESQKGRELSENPQAALCFHWKTRRRQIRVQGTVHQIAAEEADSYFHTRARKSQLGAAVSAQSRVLESRSQLEQAAAALDRACLGDVPRPAHWCGYALAPQRIEFWQDGEYRLHDRIAFTRAAQGWTKTRLYP